MPFCSPVGKGLGLFVEPIVVMARSRKARMQVAVARGAASGRPPTVEPLECRELLSTSWFVAPNGADTNKGTIASPFKTIQRAANVALAGDRVEIRAGVYHETVSPKHSGTTSAPIIFEGYNGEKVTVSGADPVTSWTRYSGNIYSASMPFDMGAGNNEVFVDGKAINEARFPNNGFDPSHPAVEIVPKVTVSGSSATIYDSRLSQPANYWNGAIIHIAPGQAWVAQSGTVTASGPGWIRYSFSPIDSYSIPKAGNAYYLTGKFQALDAPGEWYHDPSGKLYVMTPASDNPAYHDVEAKHRLYAFNLGGIANITIQNLNIFAATIWSDPSSTGTHINHITASYISQMGVMSNGWSAPLNTGIVVRGAHSIVENSNIGFSAGDGIMVSGAGSIIRNNVVHDTDTFAGDMAAIRLIGSGITVTHNTVYNAGRSGIKASVAGSTITYNVVHDVGLQTTEPGGIYTVQTNGGGATIAYNQIYNIHTAGYGGTGIFLDNYSSGFKVNHNQVWNVDYAMKMNFTCNNNVVTNNTLNAITYALFTNLQGNWNGTTISNNIFLKPAFFTAGARVTNNYYTSSNTGSAGAGDFAAGASSGSIPVTPPPPVPTPTPPPVPTPTVSAKTLVRAVNYTGKLGMQGDNFTGMGYAYDGNWLKYHLDFGTGVTTFKATVAGLYAGGRIELHIGSPTGKLVGTLAVSPTGAWNNYRQETASVAGLTGVQDLYLVFRGSTPGVANINTLTFA
ncbi:MAG: galA [Phycisphaerales bacterium]|nr:galA [Phycisphaerales bacterium]